MAVRPIDGNALIEWLRPYLHSDEPIPADVVIEDIRSMPTLTQPNEWVSVEDAVPDPGVRVLAANCSFVGEAYMPATAPGCGMMDSRGRLTHGCRCLTAARRMERRTHDGR